MRHTLFAVALALFVSGPARAEKAESKIEVGKPAPNLTLEATQIGKVLPGKKDAKTLSLKDLRGKNVVLYFYPKAMTPGCTVESCGFRDKAAELAKLNTVVIGISTDNVEDQMKFTDKEKLNFPLFADPEKKAAKTFGVLNEKSGRAMHGPSSSTRKAWSGKSTTRSSPRSIPRKWLSTSRPT